MYNPIIVARENGIDVLFDEINDDNVKKIYFLLYCNTFDPISFNHLTKYLEKHYTREEILKLNDEYMNQELDTCFSLLKNKDWESISTIGVKIRAMCGVFTYEKKTYERIIDFLIKLNTTYGYFINYPFYKKAKEKPKNEYSHNYYELSDDSFFNFLHIYITLHDNYIYKPQRLKGDLPVLRSTGVEWHYLKDDGFFGLIPRCHRLRYYDLLDRIFTELIAPIFEHFYEENDLMKKLEVEYIKYDWSTFESMGLRKIIKKYIEKYNITIPDELKKYF